MHDFEPKLQKKDILLIIGIMAVFLIFVTINVRIAFPKQEPILETVFIERVTEEGEAKAIMIRAMTGYDFPPEIAKWANVNISGTTVSIETQSINLWDGKKWR